MFNYESYLNDIKDFFENNLPSYIDTINSNNTDLKVPYPSKYLFDLPDTFLNTEKVCFYIIPWDYALEELSNESETLTANIKLIITFSRDKEENLFKIAHRYISAIHGIIKDKPDMDDIVNYSVVRGIHYENQVQEGVKSIEINFETNTEI